VSSSPGSPMMRRSFKSREDDGSKSGRSLLLWSIGGAVAIVFIAFVVLAQFSKPTNESAPAWKNVLHTIEHPVQAVRVARAKIKHEAVPTPQATPTAAPTTAPTPAPTTAPATSRAKAETAALAAVKRAEEHKAHKLKVALAGNKVTADTGTGGGAPPGLTAPIVPITPAPAKAVATTAPTATPEPVQETFTDARLMRQGNADYPMMAKDEQIQGTTVVAVTVDASGAVQSASVAQSSGNRLLDSAAVTAAYHSKFAPALKNGAPTTATARLVYNFSL